MKKIRTASKEYDLYWTYGVVDETSKDRETTVSGGGGGGATFGGYGATAPVNIVTTTTIHDLIFLTDSSGTEHSCQLQDMDVACRAGNRLSVIWAIKSGDRTGPYIAVYNHTTDHAFFNNAALYKIYRRNGWHVAVAMLVLYSISNFVFASGSTSLGYLLFFSILLLPVAWLLEGYYGAKNFKKNTSFKEFI